MKKVKTEGFHGVCQGSTSSPLVSVANDQLLCFPLPLIPAKGFRGTVPLKLCRSATLSITSMIKNCGPPPNWPLRRWAPTQIDWGYFVCDASSREYPKHALIFQIAHVMQYPSWNGTKIMVIQLLPFGRSMSQKGAARKGNIWTGGCQGFIDQKYSCSQPKVAWWPWTHFIKIFCNCGRCLINTLQWAQKWGFVVQGFPSIGNKTVGTHKVVPKMNAGEVGSQAV